MAGLEFLRHTRDEVDEIVQRLQRPTVASKHQDGTSENATLESMRSNKKLRYLGTRKATQEEIDEINKRLERPTKMSTIRERKPVHKSSMPNVE